MREALEPVLQLREWRGMLFMPFITSVPDPSGRGPLQPAEDPHDPVPVLLLRDERVAGPGLRNPEEHHRHHQRHQRRRRPRTPGRPPRCRTGGSREGSARCWPQTPARPPAFPARGCPRPPRSAPRTCWIDMARIPGRIASSAGAAGRNWRPKNTWMIRLRPRATAPHRTSMIQRVLRHTARVRRSRSGPLPRATLGKRTNPMRVRHHPEHLRETDGGGIQPRLPKVQHGPDQEHVEPVVEVQKDGKAVEAGCRIAGGSGECPSERGDAA